MVSVLELFVLDCLEARVITAERMCRSLIDSDRLFPALVAQGMASWQVQLEQQLPALFRVTHGDLPHWLTALAELPTLPAQHIDLLERVAVDAAAYLATTWDKDHLEQQLRQFCPWRKGPYWIHGVHIDTEWRSDWKWQRILPHISPLAERVVLDVGCGNGYHAWRMAGQGARLVVGIDPSWLFLAQFNAIRHFLGVDLPVYLLPLTSAQMPAGLQAFDTVFSMGVLYHRRAPIEHLQELRSCLKPGGELVLETLVIEGNAQALLVPADRYAKMRNVWFLPSTAMLELWLQRTGFRDIRLVDLNRTSVDEQRSTSWMAFESLTDFLDPQNERLTIEGYPAPLRATFLARA